MSRFAAGIVAASLLFGGQEFSPAERAVAAARSEIAKDPAKPDGYNALAIALTRLARETSEVRFYREAETAVTKSLSVAADNFDALKARCWILLGQHEFAQALDLARKLNARMPDDHLVYGFLVDANAELGNYEAAEKAAQWMLDMSRGGIPALTRTAYLREAFGDPEGALELMRMAYARLHPAETEDRAWVLVQSGDLLITHGKLAEASTLLNEAESLFPNYHYGLAARARLENARGNHRQALALWQRRYELAPHPENLFDVAVALHKCGMLRESRTTGAEFERLALAESAGWDNANRELIAWYSDYANRPADALKIAEREIARRHDIQTVDAYAWALYRSKRHKEAAAQIEKALAVGTNHPRILKHAEIIRRAAGNSHATKRPQGRGSTSIQ